MKNWIVLEDKIGELAQKAEQKKKYGKEGGKKSEN